MAKFATMFTDFPCHQLEADMQAIVGSVIFIIVVLLAAVVSIHETEGTGLRRFSLVLLYFFGIVAGCYVAFAVVGGFFWVIWWIGIVIREILQWLVEAVLYPWYWLFSHLF